MIAGTPAHAHHEVPALVPDLTRFPSINALVDHWARAQPQRIAFIGPSAIDGWRRISWQDLRQESRRLAAHLAACGIARGDHVGILAHGDAYIECLVGYMALLRLGAVMVPLNPRYAQDELAYTIDYADCVALLAQPALAPRIDAMLPALPKVRTRLAMTLTPPPGWQGWRAATDLDAPIGGFPEITRSDLANILFTSGTTARPKGVMHDHGSALATGVIFAAALALRNTDIFHHAIPFFTSSGAQFSLMPALWVGATLLVEPAFDAQRVLQRIEDEQSTAMIGVPSHYLFMLDALSRQPRELPSMRLWDYGGAPMPSSAAHALARQFPQAEQRQNYGMTETGPSGALLTPEEALRRAGSLGLPMPLCEVQVIDPQGQCLMRGEVGEIRIRSAACMRGYYKDPQATARTLQDGWVRTGDVGRMDQDGFLYYEDRIKDIINRGGLKISSMEVEEVLYRHPDVLEAAVVATPHPMLGEDLAACVVAKPGAHPDVQALVGFCRQHLADYKAPRRILLVESLPKNPMGKIQKTILRDRLAAQETESPRE